jgi:hypothetical protein
MSWQSLKKYYVYTYYTDDNIPYYIGMGQKRRVIDNHKYVTVPSWENIKVVDNLTLEQAQTLEIKLIEKYGMQCNDTGILENLQAGGKTQKSGWYHSEQAKNKIAQGNTGKVRTSEHRKNYSKPKSAEHAENIRRANLGRKNSPERNSKISDTLKQLKWYNNGQEQVRVLPQDKPAGFVNGMLSREQRINNG